MPTFARWTAELSQVKAYGHPGCTYSLNREIYFFFLSLSLSFLGRRLDVCGGERGQGLRH